MTFLDSIESPEGKAIADKRSAIFRREFLPHLEPTRGAQRLLESLRDDRKSDPVDLLEHYDLSPFKRRLPLRSA